jgi:hypothetical protein
MSFYHNRHSRRKQTSVNRAKNNYSPEHSFDPLSHSSLPADKSDDAWLDIQRAHFHTMMLVIALRHVAHNYCYAIKPRDIASLEFAKVWDDARQHLKQWIDKPAIIRLLRAEMTIINRAFDGILDDGEAVQ